MKNNFLSYLLPDATLKYYSQFLSPEEAQHYFSLLSQELAWEQRTIKLFGKAMLQPRLVAWYGEPGIQYTYSKVTLTALPWHPTLKELQDRLFSQLALSFNSVLCNLYRDGKDSMGWHSDDEPELGKNPTIASLSLGTPRMFHLKHKRRKEFPTTKIELEPGSLLIMSGKTQANWKHQLPKTSQQRGPRINLTYRLITNV